MSMLGIVLFIQVGIGQKIFLWHDTWHPKGPLLMIYGPRILIGTGLTIDTKLHFVIHNSQGKWPGARTQTLIYGVLSPTVGEYRIIWLSSKSEKFKLRSNMALH